MASNMRWWAIQNCPITRKLIDAYSNAVSGAVAAAHPAVVHIEVQGNNAPAARTFATQFALAPSIATR